MLNCPVCQAENNQERKVCSNCGFHFDSPGRENHQGPTFAKYFALDWVNITAIIVVILLLVGTLGGYLFWSFIQPANSWLLATSSEEKITKLYILNEKSGFSLEIAESDSIWTPKLHLSLDLSSLVGSPQAELSGTWKGGMAVYSPQTQKLITAVKYQNNWQVGITDMQSRIQTIFWESEDNEPFLSIAPTNAKTAISLQATDSTPPRIYVFDKDHKIELPDQPHQDTLSPNAKIAPNGDFLLYTDTITNTQSDAKDQSLYHTTFYLIALTDGRQTSIYEFDHDKRSLPTSTSYEFAPDSTAVVYQTEEKQLYQTRLTDFVATRIYSPSENISTINWAITPGSDQLTLFTDKLDIRNEWSLSLINLDTGQEKIIDESIQSPHTPSLTFLDTYHLLYISATNQQVIYNLASETPERFETTGNTKIGCPVISWDRNFVGFGLIDNGVTDFHFYSLPHGDAFNLDFNFDGEVKGYNLGARYIAFFAKSKLYYKDILSNAQVVQITGANPNLPAILSFDQSHLLYMARLNDVSGIYRVRLGGERGELLLKQAEILAPQPQKWCLEN